MPAPINNVHRLFPASANENLRGIAYASITEAAVASDTSSAYQPIAGFDQAADSTERGFLQALARDPWV
jgi:hypothetical protein